MPFSDTERNRVADYGTASNMTIRVHTGDPGTAGTSNRIGSVEAALASTNWSAAASGISSYNAQVVFTVLSTTAEQTVRWYSLWRGGTFVGREEMSSAVAVPANGVFIINSGEIQYQATTS